MSKQIEFPTESQDDVDSVKNHTDPDVNSKFKITKGLVDSIKIYEVSESELGVLENGSISSTYLNFAIFFASIFVSFLISLLTTDFGSADKKFLIFLVIDGVSFCACLVTGVVWIKSNNEFGDVMKRIKARIK